MAKSSLTGCDPAELIINLLGGRDEVSRIAGVDPNTVYRWRIPYESGGTSGYIPRRYHKKIIEFAASKGIPLTPAAFIDKAAIPIVLSPERAAAIRQGVG